MLKNSNDLELCEPTICRQQAVFVRRAFKQYGSKNKPFPVLSDLNMTVPVGAIYGLLGASGCGKTTLLGCITGRKRLNSGDIWVLGGKPGSKSSGVPGPKVGFMPQEVALYHEFSIRETLKYFGWINGMTTEKIEERLQFLANLLLLPDADQLVGELSGGQQRRVSLAATLLHEPELLILDEPTVGVDPLLRHDIWKHLTDITKNQKATVILTTHYIDEATQAEMIGLMRGGYLLAEESPTSLMSKHNNDSLEQIFLKLSIKQNTVKKSRCQDLKEAISGKVNEAVVLDDEIGQICGGNELVLTEPSKDALPELPSEKDSKPFRDYFKIVDKSHMYALIWKNFLWLWKNLSITSIFIILPTTQCILFCLCIGHEPTELPISVVNYELEEMETCKPFLGCDSTRLSCNYLTYLEKKTLQLSYYPNETEGKNAVRQGKAWATVIFPHNFSDAIRNRVYEGRKVKQWDLDSSTVVVYQDRSNEHIGIYVQRGLYFAFADFFQEYLTSCNIKNKTAQVPISWQKPVYGFDSPEFTDFLSAGIIITIIFFLAVPLTAVAIIIERKDGNLERTLVNGITNTEMLLSHMTTSWVIMFIQTSMLLIFSFPIFGLAQNGSYVTVIALLLITGFCGMCFGFLIACACKDEMSATYLAMGSFLPMILLCGIIWPIEGMHKILQVITFVLPLTKSTQSLRCILSRGWDIDSPDVYAGFISNAVWIVIFLGTSICLLKFKKE